MKKNRKFLESKILWLSVNILLVFMIFLIEVYPIEKPIWWSDLYSLFLSISTGGLVSFFFYWLVVFTPEQRKRQTIKSNLFRMYQMIKEDIAYQVVFASIKGGRTDLTADVNTISKLLTTTGFREAFEGGREGDEGFYAFENQMSNLTPEFQEIIINLEMLSSQIGFILHNYTIDDRKIFDFF